MKKRLFIAFPIPEETKIFILDQINFQQFYKITKKENIHITLLFLGDVEEKNIPEIIIKLKDSIKNQKKINLGIDSFDRFPINGIPKLIYLTGEKGKTELINFANKIRGNLKKLGFHDDKDFKYHITVGRINERKKIISNFILPKINIKTEFIANKVILFQSELQKTGPIYTPIWQEELK